MPKLELDSLRVVGFSNFLLANEDETTLLDHVVFFFNAKNCAVATKSNDSLISDIGFVQNN